jgi:glutamate synthase (NADPH/NADH) small chain
MEKWVIDRRLEQMTAEGVEFQTNVDVGRDVSADRLRREYDAVLLATGAMVPRDLKVPGRELAGVHFAMDYLTQQNKITAGDPPPAAADRLTAEGKRVVIIGGGDTGSDCLGTAHRQGVTEVSQFELLSEPPPQRDASTPWPYWPMQLRSSHAHEEGCQREWSVSTTKFSGRNGRVEKLHAVRVEFEKDAQGKNRMVEVPNSAFELDVDLVLLAMGFTGPEKPGLLTDLGVALDPRGNVAVNADYMSSVPGVFAAGDAKRGASLIVWAIAEGRKAAAGVERYLKTKSPVGR